jgi:DNA-binding transcriptional regulator YiaG
MKTKNLKKYIYEGLGFPVELYNVEVVMHDGEWQPKVDARKIAESVVRGLPFQVERLTGNQIKFIRTYFEMSLRDFGKNVVNESHTAVAKWEKFGNKSTNMDENIEILLRLYIYEKVAIKNKKQRAQFFDKYLKLRDMDFTKNTPKINLKNK